ncbi:MAG: glucokinase [bacterium]
MILAGDVGGTKIHLALFRRKGPRLVRTAEEIVATADAPSAGAAVGSFCARHAARPDAAALGVAGPVTGGAVRGANLPWILREQEIVDAIGGAPVRLVNDLAASAHGLGELGPADLVALQEGTARPDANRGLVSPGTGLGECVIHRVAGRWEPVATEGGHADFAARTDEEIDLLLWLRAEFGRASAERVVSGPGLVNVFQWLRVSGRVADDARFDAEAEGHDLPAMITAAALAGSSRLCAEAMRIWVTAFGAESGNVALRGLTLGGVFLGGGIPARVLAALREPWFLEAFRDKEPHRRLLEQVPVWVVLNSETPLLGAARLADALAREAGR